MSIALKNNIRLVLAAGLLAGTQGVANASGLSPIRGAIGEAKPIIDVRLRYENVEQAGIAREADATTIRARLGVETGKAWNTSFLGEGELLAPITTNYNDTVNGKTQYPGVPDPRNYEVNRLQVANTSITQTTITLGRQRINLDDQRFVGAAGWRQNEQTFDALRVVNKGINNLTVDITYFNQVNRVFGKDSTAGRYRGDNFLSNVAYQTPFGKFTGFGYFLKFDRSGLVAATNDSNATYGVRYNGEKPISKIKLAYVASYARQRDYGYNALSFDNDYYMGEVTGTFRQFNAGVGIEVLGGDGVKGFTTPLATLHKFQGWADKFLTTPVNGIDDRYVNAGWLKKGVGPLDTLSATASYHDYRSARLNQKYGSEVNLLFQAKYRRFTGMLKYADYSADGLFTDTKKIWAQIEYIW